MRYTITTPLAGVTGMHAGVNFTNGTAVVDDSVPEQAAALAYFTSAGYGIEPVEGEKPKRRRVARTDETDTGSPPEGGADIGDEPQGGTQ